LANLGFAAVLGWKCPDTEAGLLPADDDDDVGAVHGGDVGLCPARPSAPPP
jgi:hypothetical protein